MYVQMITPAGYYATFARGIVRISPDAAGMAVMTFLDGLYVHTHTEFSFLYAAAKERVAVHSVREPVVAAVISNEQYAALKDRYGMVGVNGEQMQVEFALDGLAVAYEQSSFLQAFDALKGRDDGIGAADIIAALVNGDRLSRERVLEAAVTALIEADDSIMDGGMGTFLSDPRLAALLDTLTEDVNETLVDARIPPILPWANDAPDDSFATRELTALREEWRAVRLTRHELLLNRFSPDIFTQHDAAVRQPLVLRP